MMLSGGSSGTQVKFNAVVGTDSMIKNGLSKDIQTKLLCLTAMPNYQSKSVEELRVEDYQASRKFPAVCFLNFKLYLLIQLLEFRPVAQAALAAAAARCLVAAAARLAAAAAAVHCLAAALPLRLLLARRRAQVHLEVRMRFQYVCFIMSLSATNTGGGLFGSTAPKPSLFGGAAAAPSAFGAPTATSAFGGAF